jgi:hypothetical protein
MVNYKCLYKEAQLKSELQHGVWLLCRMHYSSATFALLYFRYHMQKFSTYLLTHSMQQIPSWEANRFFFFFLDIPRILWNPKVHYRIHKCPLPGPILSQLDSVHTPKPHSLNTHLNIILPSMPGSPKWSLSFTFPYQNPGYTSPLPYMLHAPPISFFSILSPEQYWWAVQIIRLLIM